MAQRIGLVTIRAIAYRLCGFVATFGPIIRRTYPTNAALIAALDAAGAACHVLVSEADAQLPVGD